LNSDNFINPYSESLEEQYNRIRYNEHDDNEIPMTFILGAKCLDGVVMVADKKVTIVVVLILIIQINYMMY
jgi:hypothetical protein